MMRYLLSLLVILGLAVVGDQTTSADDENQTGQDAPKPGSVAGKADVLRRVPKKFAKLTTVNASTRQVGLHVDGEKAPKTWRVNVDAELKVNGWWGRLDQFDVGDRVWVWFDIDRREQPTSILMLADELSEQDIHGTGDNAVIEPMRQKQREFLNDLWRKQGLPGAITILHKLGGEMEVLLDHEAMRWGRYLKYGDKVSLHAGSTIEAAVKEVRPWRERTLVRLVTKSGVDQAGLTAGQRIHLTAPEPPADVQQQEFPTDIGRERTKHDRIEWFLSSIYCTCKINRDRCTGMFYTLASCNPNGCGSPNQTRKLLAKLFDEGKTDHEVFEHLRKSRGPELAKPHLLQ